MAKAEMLLYGAMILASSGTALPAEKPENWTVCIVNDTCPDYTWGNDEAQTRNDFAELVRSHLDEMKATDGEAPENQDHYTMAVTNEALCFLDKYPERRSELFARLREGRLCLSPFLCNTLPGVHSVEAMIRSLYPAKRLAEEGRFPLDWAEHIEYPGLPSGMALILAGCGIRWLSAPFYDYDSAFSGLTNPPLFVWEGADGSRIRVVMDPWACLRASYAQGARLLQDTDRITADWLPHYAELGDAYPARWILASGTHSDTHAGSAGQTHGFAEAIRRYNASPGKHPRLVNGSLSRFCQEIDRQEASKPFLPVVKGSFGDSWDSWAVSLAKYVADARQGDRDFLAAETLTALASLKDPAVPQTTRAERRRSEWLLAMLSDHAWNGDGEANRKENARLRKAWSQELAGHAANLRHVAAESVGLHAEQDSVGLFNSLGLTRSSLVHTDAGAQVQSVQIGKTVVPAQTVVEEGRPTLAFVTPPLPGFSLTSARLLQTALPVVSGVTATQGGLEGRYYRLRVDPASGAVVSLVEKATGRELVRESAGRGICDTVANDGSDHRIGDVRVEVEAMGPVLGRLAIHGSLGDARVITRVTLYAELNRVDFDVRIDKPATAGKLRICQQFPVGGDDPDLRVETPGAIIRPRLQPDGDMLPGADLRHMAVQSFVDVATGTGGRVIIAPWDSYLLRLDLSPLSFEALGNDRNYEEVTKDQNGETQFRFRYSLLTYPGDFAGVRAATWSREAVNPALALPGRADAVPQVSVSAGSIATCLKPADDGRGVLLRAWNLAGLPELRVSAPWCQRATQTDLLERDIAGLKIARGTLSVPARPLGFTAVRLEQQ